MYKLMFALLAALVLPFAAYAQDDAAEEAPAEEPEEEALPEVEAEPVPEAEEPPLEESTADAPLVLITRPQDAAHRFAGELRAAVGPVPVEAVAAEAQ